MKYNTNEKYSNVLYRFCEWPSNQDAHVSNFYNIKRNVCQCNWNTNSCVWCIVTGFNASLLYRHTMTKWKSILQTNHNACMVYNLFCHDYEISYYNLHKQLLLAAMFACVLFTYIILQLSIMTIIHSTNSRSTKIMLKLFLAVSLFSMSLHVLGRTLRKL